MDFDVSPPRFWAKCTITACLQYTQNVREWRLVLYRASWDIQKIKSFLCLSCRHTALRCGSRGFTWQCSWEGVRGHSRSPAMVQQPQRPPRGRSSAEKTVLSIAPLKRAGTCRLRRAAPSPGLRMGLPQGGSLRVSTLWLLTAVSCRLFLLLLKWPFSALAKTSPTDSWVWSLETSLCRPSGPQILLTG